MHPRARFGFRPRHLLSAALAAAAITACSSTRANAPGATGMGGGPAAAGSLSRIGNAAAERFAAAPPARTELRNAEGRVIGTATFTQATHGLLIALDLTGVPAGSHAMHVHDVGQCEPPFTSAGSHFNPTIRSHGIRSANGMHAGDLPNVVVPASGTMRVEVFTRELQLGPGIGTLFDRDGSALMLHSTADDYASDPGGNAGTRYACGVIVRADSAPVRADSTRR
ncbi:MAG TPA: superoxide dismutase family protein [Gemmatirosa sp.]|nr:superoxide dismutase family protein [Gemmatirosa sp.]